MTIALYRLESGLLVLVSEAYQGQTVCPPLQSPVPWGIRHLTSAWSTRSQSDHMDIFLYVSNLNEKNGELC
jgi:hypothetical protein